MTNSVKRLLLAGHYTPIYEPKYVPRQESQYLSSNVAVGENVNPVKRTSSSSLESFCLKCKKHDWACCDNCKRNGNS